ncbi:MAG: histidine kinase dimerization/phospho-acceptor domain-containing protein [Cyanobacteria bacterium P01_C01_bin.70]
MAAVNQTRLSDLLCSAEGFSEAACLGANSLPSKNAGLVAEAEWRAAIAALTTLLPTLPRLTAPATHELANPTGIAVSGPLPVLNEADFGHRFESWVLTPQPLADALHGQRTLLPAEQKELPPSLMGMQILPLALDNPLLTERFCLIASPALSVALVLGHPTGGRPCLQYSFDPEVLMTLWQHIRAQIASSANASVNRLDACLTAVMSPPDYRVITRFAQALVANLPHRQSAEWQAQEERGRLRFTHWPSSTKDPQVDQQQSFQTLSAMSTDGNTPISTGEETELLQAMAHEIRTPLTTIRTLTRSLLRRRDLSADVKKRLSRIDAECTQQIDRFNLIFKAVELETTERDRPRSALTSIALSQIFTDAIPRWQQQAQRRDLQLDVNLPPDLPRVTSDPTLLNEVLTGVVEWFIQCLPPHSHVHMDVMLAGHQLKLQFESESLNGKCPNTRQSAVRRPPLKAVGQLLSVVPETGGVSLNLDATKNLFELLGGKLTLRQRSEQNDVLTAFLPLDTREI